MTVPAVTAQVSETSHLADGRPTADGATSPPTQLHPDSDVNDAPPCGIRSSTSPLIVKAALAERSITSDGEPASVGVSTIVCVSLRQSGETFQNSGCPVVRLENVTGY